MLLFATPMTQKREAVLDGGNPGGTRCLRCAHRELLPPMRARAEGLPLGGARKGREEAMCIHRDGLTHSGEFVHFGNLRCH